MFLGSTPLYIPADAAVQDSRSANNNCQHGNLNTEEIKEKKLKNIIKRTDDNCTEREGITKEE